MQIRKATRSVLPGDPHPIGATFMGAGVNFALFSKHAERVELCLFDEEGREERVELPEYTDEIWHGFLPDVTPNQLYGYRVYGPYDPDNGHRFNPHKLLIDPYAKELVGELAWDDALFGYRIGGGHDEMDTRDSAPFVPKCRVLDTTFGWGEDRKPNTPWSETILYEAHVKGFTKRHPHVAEKLRGTYAGLASPASIEHMKSLGITTVELMPIHAFISERNLVERNLCNYWGYNTLGFFAPHAVYASGADPLGELKTMVQRLHEAGLEVILDVVYNHTPEGNHDGPTLSWRGICNRSYYRLVKDNLRYYHNFTGCANALALGESRVLQMVMDSLRYWVEEVHVDGFRFDLAPTLARGKEHTFDPEASFFDVVRQDPTLSRVKLIAEPWDVDHEGYKLGAFPPGWAEWNDQYRNCTRRFWKGERGQAADLASRITGSSTNFEHGGRRTWAGVDYIASHDGHTLRDCVLYEEKHNEANGDDGGPDGSMNWNCGAEGPTDDAGIQALRFQQMRNLLATLFTSQGVPMLLAGDELGHTQGGNSNAYCQDNETSWIDWSLLDDPRYERLLDFTRRVIALRREHIVFRRDRFFRGELIPGTDVKDIVWLRPDGTEMQQEDWHAHYARCLGLQISGEAGIYHRTSTGRAEPDDTFALILNSGEGVEFTLPSPGRGQWVVVFDTSVEDGMGKERPVEGTIYSVGSHSFVLFRRVDEAATEPT